MHIIAKILPFSYLSVSGFRFFMLLCYMAFKITLLREEFSANITLKTFLSVWVTRWSFSFPEFLKTRKQNSQTNLLPDSCNYN